MFAALLVVIIFSAVCILVDRQKQRCPTLRWAVERSRYMVQYETVFGLWMPYRGGGAFADQVTADKWISNEILRLEGELAGSLGAPRKPFDTK